ncbi:MAG TPA: chemotaxis protein CheW [Kofleriaceae bacterium]|nr:chemotaxis protein CheW [Kofleriaceae bacterium]
MSSLDLKEFLAGYLIEVDEHLRGATRNLIEVERLAAAHQSIARPVRELFRSMHTVKGLSAMVGVDPVVELAHAMETVLRTADRAGGHLDADAVDILARGVRAVEVRVAAVGAGKEVPAAPRSLVDALAALTVTAAAPAGGPVALELPDELRGKLSPAEAEELAGAVQTGRRAVRVDFVPSPARTERGLSITTVRERLGQLGDLVKVVPMSVARSPDAPGGLAFALLVVTGADDAALADAAGAEPAAVVTLVAARPDPLVELADAGDSGSLFPDQIDLVGEPGGVVRVAVARLDDALERLSALVVTRFRLIRATADLAASGADVRELRHIVQESGQRLRDLRAAIMRARTISVAELLERVPLVVRGLSRTTGKEVRLEVDAHRAELDKAVGERLFPAILHLIRNAVDHAIEPPAERVRLGKPREGLIRVECHERGQNQLELIISDDGRGIDHARVAARAGRPEPATDEELLALITTPGLSTRDEVTTTSGRGLGMDIVKRIAVDQLRGDLVLATEPGRGTRFTVRVPLSITIVDAFSFSCAGQSFVVPVSMVDEIIEVDRASVRRPPEPSVSRRAPIGLFDRRGETVPICDLESCLDLGVPGAAPTKAILVRRNGRPFAFAVDRMIGQQEVVVRPVDDPLVRVVGVAGSTDLGDGRPTLVIDLLALSARMSSADRAIA